MVKQIALLLAAGMMASAPQGLRSWPLPGVCNKLIRMTIKCPCVKASFVVLKPFLRPRVPFKRLHVMCGFEVHL